MCGREVVSVPVSGRRNAVAWVSSYCGFTSTGAVLCFLCLSCAKHSCPAQGSCARATAMHQGCRASLSVVSALINLLVRGSCAFISTSLDFLALTIIFLLKIPLFFHLDPIEPWGSLHGLKYMPKSFSVDLLNLPENSIAMTISLHLTSLAGCWVPTPSQRAAAGVPRPRQCSRLQEQRIAPVEP